MRNSVAGSDRRHQGLGTIAPGHPDHVGPARDGVLGQLEQVVPLVKLDGLDAPFSAFILKPVLGRLSATRLRVHDQHRVSGPGGGRQLP